MTAEWGREADKLTDQDFLWVALVDTESVVRRSVMPKKSETCLNWIRRTNEHNL